MSERVWTPGPWLCAASDTHDTLMTVWADGGLAGVTQIAILPPEFKAVKANARLIAAAPDLYEALREAMTDLVIAADNMDHAAKTDGRWEGCGGRLRARAESCRAALAKAEGKSDER